MKLQLDKHQKPCHSHVVFLMFFPCIKIFQPNHPEKKVPRCVFSPEVPTHWLCGSAGAKSFNFPRLMAYPSLKRWYYSPSIFKWRLLLVSGSRSPSTNNLLGLSWFFWQAMKKLQQCWPPHPLDSAAFSLSQSTSGTPIIVVTGLSAAV